MPDETPQVELTLEQECEAIAYAWGGVDSIGRIDQSFTALARLLKQLSTEVEEVLDVHQERLDALEGATGTNQPPVQRPSVEELAEFIQRIGDNSYDLAAALDRDFDVRYKPGKPYRVEKVEQE